MLKSLASDNASGAILFEGLLEVKESTAMKIIVRAQKLRFLLKGASEDIRLHHESEELVTIEICRLGKDSKLELSAVQYGVHAVYENAKVMVNNY